MGTRESCLECVPKQLTSTAEEDNSVQSKGGRELQEGDDRTL